MFTEKLRSVAQQLTPTQIITPTETSVSTTLAPRDETMDWKTYTDNDIGLNLKYPSTWAINNYNESPDLFIYSNLISSLSNACDELGTCKQYELNNKKIIEDGSMPGIIYFDGGKGLLTVTCSGNEGGDLMPTPFYQFKFFKGDRLYETTLNDLSVKLSTNLDCNGNQYIQTLIKNIPNPIPDSQYRTYNDLLILIKQTLVLK